jgi:phosphoenolpyruvate carboxykinase (GTP)
MFFTRPVKFAACGLSGCFIQKGAQRVTLNPPANVNVASHALARWVADSARFTQPDGIVWCDGSMGERERLLGEAVKSRVLIPLNARKRPGCYLHRSNPNDVARTEQVTFICAPSAEDAGVTNNWMAPDDAYRKLGTMLEGSMRGRTMYVIPYVLGPVGSPYAKVGVQLTDSIYVALSMGLMTRMGERALGMLGDSDDFNRGLHCTLDVNPERRFICHFPQDNTIWSVGSGYGGNALLSKKCFALRIASWLGRNEGWFAEHMLIVGVRNPEGHTRYIAAAFPSACGKTNLAMLLPPPALSRWKVFTVGDDIAWLRVGPDGRLWAINPENGYFGVAPGTSAKSNANAMRMLGHDSVFTNVAMTPDGDVWWEGMDVEPPCELFDWQGRRWRADSGDPAAHPNSRFTAPITNNPVLSPHVEDPCGVPISAIVFGGRRATTAPLVMEAEDWLHGVFIGATMGSETTAAAAGRVGVVRRDPMAMLPFAGYNMGDYWRHWLTMQPRITNPPHIFMVNWFRKDAKGAFLWPGYAENMRVLKWILARIDGRVEGHQTVLGTVPEPGELDLSGLEIDAAQLRQALAVNHDEWKAEMASAGEFFDHIGRSVPDQLRELHRDLTRALETERP